jgi:hypothetical protein
MVSLEGKNSLRYSYSVCSIKIFNIRFINCLLYSTPGGLAVPAPLASSTLIWFAFLKLPVPDNEYLTISVEYSKQFINRILNIF